MKRYNDYMDAVEASDTLHQRLVELELPQKRPSAWKKYGAAAAALLLVAGVGAYGLSRGGWDALMDNFKPAAEVAPEIADVPIPDIASEDDPYAPGNRTNGGYELIHDELVSYYVLPYLDWADASALPQSALDYTLATPDAIRRAAAWDDVLTFMGGEKAMADHLLWDGLDWQADLWFLEDGTPQAAHLCAEENGLDLSLEVMKGGKVPSCVVLPDEYYETSQWQGVKITAVKITAVKGSGRASVYGVELTEKREVSLFCDGVGYKLTLYADDDARADEVCARFVRYAVSGGFHLYALSDEPAYDEDLPIEDGGVSDEDSVVMTTPYDPSAHN